VDPETGEFEAMEDEAGGYEALRREE